jgi:hypothetical protein
MKRLGKYPLIGEANRPILFFADFNVPALTSGHHEVHPAMEFPNYIALNAIYGIQTVSSAKRATCTLIV